VLLDDLAERGLLEKTLVITLGEFGRTPQINPSLGRDHFATPLPTCDPSAARGAPACRAAASRGHGSRKTDDDGVKVARGEVGAEALFATIFNALGIDHKKTITWARVRSRSRTPERNRSTRCSRDRRSEQTESR